MDLVFYTNPMSRGRIVRWMLEEVGAPYSTEIVAYGDMKSAAHRAVNPMGKVPVIRHGETVVTECAAICAYLADAFPQAGLAPAANSAARGPYYRWMFFAAGPLEAATTNRSLGVTVPDDKRGFVGYGSYETTLDALEDYLSRHDYIADGRFSAADVYVGSHVGWGLMFGSIEKRPAFEAYAGRLMGRPAAVRARGIDDAILAEQKAQSAS